MSVGMSSHPLIIGQEHHWRSRRGPPPAWVLETGEHPTSLLWHSLGPAACSTLRSITSRTLQLISPAERGFDPPSAATSSLANLRAQRWQKQLVALGRVRRVRVTARYRRASASFTGGALLVPNAEQHHQARGPRAATDKDGQGGRVVVAMGWTNLIITGTIVASAAVLLKGDVKHSATVLRRNLKQIQAWVKEEANSVTRCARRHRALAHTSFGDHGLAPQLRAWV
jgi:hypothetical protein